MDKNLLSILDSKMMYFELSGFEPSGISVSVCMCGGGVILFDLKTELL